LPVTSEDGRRSRDDREAVTIDLSTRRRCFAEEIAAVANLRTPLLIDALAIVPREAYLRPGPWLVRGELESVARPTPDADARHVCHNYSIAIDADRQLFNGAPGMVAASIDALAIAPGDRVLHVGAGLGYYTALLSHMVGPRGGVVAIEVDSVLADHAQANLAGCAAVDLRHGDATASLAERFDAILISAGATHPQPAWLHSLRDGGRLILPLTATMPAMGRLGKGITVLVTNIGGRRYAARTLGMTAIYSGVGLRNDTMNERLGQALLRAPMPRLEALRVDPHEATRACWLHGEDACFCVDESRGGQ
jgi:protein-L-isoaspartate(D-aspartate) O-methyltransferase